MKPYPSSQRGVYFVWVGLAAFVVVGGLLLWPAGMSGWRFATFAVGAATGAVAVVISRDRVRERVWSISGFLMGGATVITVFHGPFDVRQACGFVFLAALLIFDISRMTPTRRHGRPGTPVADRTS